MIGTDLVVTCDRMQVGTTSLVGERLSFIYAPSWLAYAEAFPISMSLPLVSRRYEPDEAHPFFANLLPEQDFAQSIGMSERLVISELRTLAGSIGTAFAKTETEFTREHGKTPVAAIISKVIKEQVRRTMALLA